MLIERLSLPPISPVYHGINVLEKTYTFISTYIKPTACAYIYPFMRHVFPSPQKNHRSKLYQILDSLCHMLEECFEPRKRPPYPCGPILSWSKPGSWQLIDIQNNLAVEWATMERSIFSYCFPNPSDRQKYGKF